jgi:mRNA deadenylase 3'-5' endonuclease subunit Ccr4
VPFTLLSCNVLADSYIRREWYPHTPDAWLTPQVRHPALAAQLAASGANVLCLQEVEGDVFALLQRELATAGYTGALALKGGNKPDGCATFWRGGLAPESQQRLEYHDAAPGRDASGHIAQITVLRDGARRLGIANTHLKWDEPKAAPDAQYGLAQIRELVTHVAAHAPPCDAWIFCGDFNVTPEAPVIELLVKAGYLHAHGDHPAAYTAAPNRSPRVIDYLFHSAALASSPLLPAAITGATPLPGPDHPSDHLALAARFDWR